MPTPEYDPHAPTGVDYEALQTFMDFCHEQAVARGFQELPDELEALAEKLRSEGNERLADYLLDIETGNRQMLFVGEASEAHEQTRGGHEDNETYYFDEDGNKTYERFAPDGTMRKPEGVPSEYADIFIRLMNEAGRKKIPIPAIVKEKLEFNATRARYHGGKKY